MKKSLNENKKTILNLLSALIAYGMSVVINFFLSPYITETLGVEANGFVTLANQVVGYVSIVTVALNSMASRFVSVNLMDKHEEKAKGYFSSVTIANIVMGILLFIPLVICSLNVGKIFNVPDSLLADTKLLFILVSINFVVGIITNIYSVSTFVVNKLYLSSVRNIVGNLLRCGILLGMYAFLPPKMYYITLSVIVNTVYVVGWNIYFTRKYTPQLKIKMQYFKLSYCIELIKSGAWNLLSSLNSVLNTGLDLLLCNIFIDPVSMGVLSVSKIFPTAISSMINSVSGAFGPEMTQKYADGDYDGFTKSILKSVKLIGIVINIPVVVLVAMGKEFYRVWQPSLNEDELFWLSFLAIAGVVVSGSTACVFGMFTIVNKLKFHSITSLLFGVLNAVVVIVALSVSTENGVYIIAGTSTILTIIRNYLLTFPYAAKCLKQKWFVFHKASLVSIIAAAVSTACSYFAVKLIDMSGWFTVILGAGICAVITVIVSALILFTKEEKKQYINIILKKLKRA